MNAILLDQLTGREIRKLIKCFLALIKIGIKWHVRWFLCHLEGNSECFGDFNALSRRFRMNLQALENNSWISPRVCILIKISHQKCLISVVSAETYLLVNNYLLIII